MKRYFFENSQGHKYEVVFKKLNKKCNYMGICDDPEEDRPKIVIDNTLSDKSLLNTIIHEFAHAFFWDSTEKNVSSFANKVTKLLYSMGWKYEKNEIRQAKKTSKRNPRKIL